MSEVPDIHWQALLRHNRPLKPIIAAVEGFAVAGGTEILQGTDIRVAAEDAGFFRSGDPACGCGGRFPTRSRPRS
jgi:enoyl-CoA hydratase